jgi:hypothetical protein
MGEWKEQEMEWTPEPEIPATISMIVARLRARGLTAEAAEVAALLRPLSVALDKSA